MTAELRARFVADPRAEALRFGLDEKTAAALERIDRDGLALAADSFARKRATAASSTWMPRPGPAGRGELPSTGLSASRTRSSAR